MSTMSLYATSSSFESIPRISADFVILAKDDTILSQHLSKIADQSFTSIHLSGFNIKDDSLIAHLFRLVKAQNSVLVEYISSDELSSVPSLVDEFKIQGFSKVEYNYNPESKNIKISGTKPSWDIGSSATLPKANIPSAWKLAVNDLAEDDMIDENDLLNDTHVEAKMSSDCGVEDETGKRRACKNCSCGLAEELQEEESKGASKAAVSEAKSSCGNCAKGDAFRCASCPYLGTPAFEPGQEKVVLSMNVSDF